ncbi:MAG: hypothetical protein FWD17_08090 [Polyangiaceae bacterium]|nr:hypothetical protein [Polyangiaceae bacterium]
MNRAQWPLAIASTAALMSFAFASAGAPATQSSAALGLADGGASRGDSGAQMVTFARTSEADAGVFLAKDAGLHAAADAGAFLAADAGVQAAADGGAW